MANVFKKTLSVTMKVGCKKLVGKKEKAVVMVMKKINAKKKATKTTQKCRLQKMALESGSLEDGSPENNEKKVIFHFFSFKEKRN